MEMPTDMDRAACELQRLLHNATVLLRPYRKRHDEVRDVLGAIELAHCGARLLTDFDPCENCWRPAETSDVEGVQLCLECLKELEKE